jgi:hypothetical protein
MGFTHLVLLGILLLSVLIAVGGFVWMSRILGKDEATDAATFLALRELRERLERGDLPRR